MAGASTSRATIRAWARGEEPVEGMIATAFRLVEETPSLELLETAVLEEGTDHPIVEIVLGGMDDPALFAADAYETVGRWQLAHTADYEEIEVEMLTSTLSRPPRSSCKYHAARPSARNSIALHGLLPDPSVLERGHSRRWDVQGPAVYMGDHRGACDFWEGGVPSHIWEIDARGLRLERDSRAGRASVSHDEIPPERLRLMSEEEASFLMKFEYETEDMRWKMQCLSNMLERASGTPHESSLRTARDEVRAFAARLHGLVAVYESEHLSSDEISALHAGLRALASEMLPVSRRISELWGALERVPDSSLPSEMLPRSAASASWR